MPNRLVVVAFALVALLALAWSLFSTAGPPAPLPNAGADRESPRSAPVMQVPREGAPLTTAAAAPQRTAVAAREIAAPTTGQLVVHARFADDKQPAAAMTVIVCAPGEDLRMAALRQRTDGTGTVRFAALPPARYRICSDRLDHGTQAEIHAGETCELDYELPPGLTITGIVVDPTGAPVAGAAIEVAWLARADADAEVVASSDASGHFRVRGEPTACLVGARAAGFAASPLRFLLGKDGNLAEVRLELGAAGGIVDGIVVDGDGNTVAGAVVVIGSGRTSGIAAIGDGAPPLPALVRSDQLGLFHAVGIHAGEQPVRARAAGFAPWQGSCEVTANLMVPLRVQLSPGATVRGVVRDASGAAVTGAEVSIGDWDDFARYRTRTAADGTFEILGLPTGEVEVEAAHDDLGKASELLRTQSGIAVDCELQLSRGLELKGRVVDDRDAPVAAAFVECSAPRPDSARWWGAFCQTDADGRFAIANCPEGSAIAAKVSGRGIELLQRRDIDPKAGELLLRVIRAQPASVHIRGTVTAPDGTPLANAMVSAARKDVLETTGIQATDQGGHFDLGPLVPGQWQVWVRSEGFPEFASDTRQLPAAAKWELGTVQLAIGGTARVQLEGGDAKGVRMRAIDAAEHPAASVDRATSRTGPLAPGDYRLLVFGVDTAAQSVPFVIRAGEVTAVPVRLQSGVRQSFELLLPAGAEVKGGVALRLASGGDYVGRTWTAVKPGQPCSNEMCLRPGSYTATATADNLRGSAAFTVGSGAGAPVRIELR